MISLVGKHFMKKEKFNVSLQPQFLSDLSSGDFFSHLKVEKNTSQEEDTNLEIP